MNVRFNITPTKSQKEAWNIIHKKEIQTLVCRWSRQNGKSVFAEMLLIEYLFKPNTFNAYISPTFGLGRKVYKEIINLLENANIIKSANASTLTIETVFKSTLQFFSIESYTAIRGNTVTGILVMDEAAFYPDTLPNGDEPWSSVIMPITKARKPKILVISTPKGKRGMFYQMYLKALNGEKGYAQITSDIYSDDLVSEEQIEEIRKNITELAWREEFLVEFLDSSLTFFNGFEECFKNYDIHYYKTYIGVDLSGSGQDETIVTKINEKNETESFKIEGTLDVKYVKIAKLINESVNLQGCYIEQNGVGQAMYEQIKKLVNKKSLVKAWTTTNSSKEEIISDLAVVIAKGEITFNKNNTNLFSQLSTFIVKRSKTNKLQFEASAGFHDDYVLSLAIAFKAKNDLSHPFTKNNFAFIDNNLSKYNFD